MPLWIGASGLGQEIRDKVRQRDMGNGKTKWRAFRMIVLKLIASFVTVIFLILVVVTLAYMVAWLCDCTGNCIKKRKRLYNALKKFIEVLEVVLIITCVLALLAAATITIYDKLF
jgi:uncharacterized membrane protein